MADSSITDCKHCCVTTYFILLVFFHKGCLSQVKDFLSSATLTVAVIAICVGVLEVLFYFDYDGHNNYMIHT